MVNVGKWQGWECEWETQDSNKILTFYILHLILQTDKQKFIFIIFPDQFFFCCKEICNCHCLFEIACFG